MKSGADAYKLRNLSFELMLLTRGYVHFDFDNLDMLHPIYESTVSSYIDIVKIKLVELAIHQRNLDDELNNLVSDSSHDFHNDRSIMKNEFTNQKYAFDSINDFTLSSLREISNKIIHADKFKLEGASEGIISDKALFKIGKPELARVVTLQGKKHKTDWCVHFDMLVYCEQSYLFAEILAERYGI